VNRERSLELIDVVSQIGLIRYEVRLRQERYTYFASGGVTSET